MTITTQQLMVMADDYKESSSKEMQDETRSNLEHHINLLRKETIAECATLINNWGDSGAYTTFSERLIAHFESK